ncbi:hypothetical protein BJY01DRAFT_249290 [Aspergillus pseudoustus]|uniref:Xylanolytic transcriptional activator regulatory domain-containing protein n=1 Tax=Aspergillus pseudoustus TaxID=1810923 RepID=A0ABR4JPU3_9EURO
MFRLISKHFTNTAILFPSTYGATQATKVNPCSDCEKRQRTKSHPPRNRANHTAQSLHSLPPLNEAMGLFDRYFSTIRVVLPYVDEGTIVNLYQGVTQVDLLKRRRATLALLNMVWAHAAASLGSSQRETFYKKAVALMDSRDIERPSYELVQTLLLFVEYKQNHQRSISSYTAHALCVKAAFHVGLHSRAARAASKSPEERQLRLRLWNGVLKNERIMNITQGRPCMIPRSLLADDDVLRQGGSIGDVYLGTIGPSYAIIDKAMDSLYDENVELGDRSQSQTLLANWTEISWSIDQFYDSLSILGGQITRSELPELLAKGPTTHDQSLAVRILLSIHCNRLRLLANFPLIAHSLSLRLGNHLPEILHEDWEAAWEICSVISVLGTHSPGFIDELAAWYTCNYTMLTVTLNFLVILLLKKHDAHILPLTSLAEVRQQIEEALSVMEQIGKNSLITQKAGCCIKRMLAVFDNLGAQARVASLSDPGSLSDDFWSTDYVMQDIARYSHELLEQIGRDEGGDSSDLDPSFLDLYSRIPVCE